MHNALKILADEPVVKVENLSICYGNGTEALKDISINIRKGEHLALIGPSGSGKSSLLASIAGRLKPSCGACHCSLKAATIYQDLRLVERASAIENVLHGSLGRLGASESVFGFSKEDRARASELLESVGLSHRTEVVVEDLSGGERQRVAIARALMQDPGLLLADEPVASLDQDKAVLIMELLGRIASEHGITVVSVLHDISLAQRYADRAIKIVGGRVAGEDSCLQSPTGLRVVGDQETHAFEELSGNYFSQYEADQELPSPSPVRNSTQPYLFTLALVMVAYWCFNSLSLETADTLEAIKGAVEFSKNLIPSSTSELQRIPWGSLFLSLIETLQIALLGTLGGIAIALPSSALAARSAGSPSLIRFAVRFLMNTVRTIPSIIWALLFVAAVGLGPLAGVLSLIAYSVGYLGKFFYEGFELVDPGAPDALQEIGASRLQRFRHAVWPAAIPGILTSSLFVFEYNIRAASILGIVDAGGIGFYLKQYMDYRFFPAVTAGLLMMLVVVLVCDFASCWLRKTLIKSRH